MRRDAKAARRPHRPATAAPRTTSWAAPSVFELHALLHAGARTNPLAPGLQMLQPGVVRKRLAAGIDRVDRQIGGGDFVAGQVLRLGKLLVGKAPQIDEAILVEPDR